MKNLIIILSLLFFSACKGEFVRSEKVEEVVCRDWCKARLSSGEYIITSDLIMPGESICLYNNYDELRWYSCPQAENQQQ